MKGKWDTYRKPTIPHILRNNSNRTFHHQALGRLGTSTTLLMKQKEIMMTTVQDISQTTAERTVSRGEPMEVVIKEYTSQEQS